MEGPKSSFQHVSHVLVHVRILKRSGCVGNSVVIGFVYFCVNNLVGIADNGQIGVMRYYEHLTSLSSLLDTLYKHFGNGVIIKITLRLINNKGQITLVD